LAVLVGVGCRAGARGRVAVGFARPSRPRSASSAHFPPAAGL